MDDLVAQSGRNGEGATVDQRAGGSSSESAGVTNRAAYGCKQRVAANCRCWYRILTTRSTRGSHEVGECKHVVAVVFRILHGIERRRERDLDYAFSSAGRVFVGSGISRA